MNAELLAMLGSVPGVSVRMNAEPKTLLSFKAGKMNAERQSNGKFLVKPDPRRGTLDVTWTPVSQGRDSSSSNNNNNGMLKLEWKDRRTRAVVDSIKIFPEDECTYTKVITGPNRESDRVYLLQFGNQSERRFFFWMQEKEEGNLDEENCVKINTYMADPAEAAAAARGETVPAKEENNEETKEEPSGAEANTTSNALDSTSLTNIMQGLSNNNASNTNNTEASAASAAPQVDALSNILENLGMPQPNNTSAASSAPPAAAVTATPAPTSTSAATPSAPAPKSSSGGGLTLSDLQGAMAGLATTSPPTSGAQPTIPPLSEVASPEHILASGILSNESIKQKLIALLPESQQTEEHLMTNLRSAQVTQCLKSLTAALCDDGTGESFNSILANFQLRPEDGAIAMASGNPVQAFLDCVLKSVQREQDEKKKKEEMEEEAKADGGKDKDGDAEMKE